MIDIDFDRGVSLNKQRSPSKRLYVMINYFFVQFCDYLILSI